MIQSENEGALLVLRISGDLEFEVLDLLKSSIQRGWNDGVESMRVDLRDCTYINSEAISSLIMESRENPKRFSISIKDYGIARRVFEVLGLLDTSSPVRVYIEGLELGHELRNLPNDQ